eukprot:1198878-Prorocentrum_lima.AAC.1
MSKAKASAPKGRKREGTQAEFADSDPDREAREAATSAADSSSDLPLALAPPRRGRSRGLGWGS